MYRDEEWAKKVVATRSYGYGDLHWLHGKVARKFQEGPRCRAESETWAESRRDAG